MANILVIDDMIGVRRAVSSMLKRAGHQVTEADNGRSGLEMLGKQKFDLVVADILMPELDGTEVMFHLAAQSSRPKVIAMSGGGAGVSAEAALRTARLKADAFLEKPFEKADLLGAIERLLPG